MSESHQFFLYLIDLLGVAVFAISGALAAARKEMDIFGFVVLAMAPAIGGGTLRDLIIDQPVFWVVSPSYVLVCGGVAVLTFFTAHHLRPDSKALVWADAIGLALFTVIGTEKTLGIGASPIIAAMMGVITAAAGGIVRDMMCGEIPLIFQKEVYAFAALLGALGYLGAFFWAGGSEVMAAHVGFFVALVVRLCAIHWGWSLPKFQRKAPLS